MLLLITILLLVCTSCTSKQQETTGNNSQFSPDNSQFSILNSQLNIIFTGDVLLDRGVRPYAEREGIPALFAGVDSVFRQADAVIVNLECPLTETVSPVNKLFVFRGEPQWAKGLREAGVTHAAMANNHTYDQGRQGLLSTYQHLKDAGIEPLGFGHTKTERLEPVVIRKGTAEVALFNSVPLPLENWYDLDNRPGICQASASTLANAIRSYRATHPHTKIIAVLHWGVELQAAPSMQQRIDAQTLLQAGTDVIVGHHPHVVQPLRYLNGKPVFYSLGNFVFDQSLPLTHQAAMAQITIQGDSISAKSLPVRIVNNKPTLNM